MNKIYGIPASPGIVHGPAYVFQSQDLKIELKPIADPDGEWLRLQNALEEARLQIAAIISEAEHETSADEAAIFEAHALFLEDPVLINQVKKMVYEDRVNVEHAWETSIEGFANQMESMADEYFQARAADIRDVGHRVLAILLSVDVTNFSLLREPSIIVARDLSPSDTIQLDKRLVLGFCTAMGGPTSHTAILAKALNLPAVVGAGNPMLDISTGSIILLDGSSGEVVINPNVEVLTDFKERKRINDEHAKADLSLASEPAISLDGHPVEVVANVGNLDDAKTAIDFGAEGIGLLRTEFLFLERNAAPNEEEQLQAYDAILDIMEHRPVVVRTLDIGGDKEIPYLGIEKEINPFLGWRAIRLCLDQPDFFKIQLRALLRSSPGHDLRIMFPMIATLEEVRKVKHLIEEARQELRQASQPFAEQTQLGIMVEVPSITVLADQFAKEVDFFSIGTNDLTQYTLAADRTNVKVSHLGDACNPAVLRQIQWVIKAAHQEGIWVGLCGELAGDPDAIPILLGLGLDEFSMAPSSIPRAKAVIRRWSRLHAEKIAQDALMCDSANAVREFVRKLSPT